MADIDFGGYATRNNILCTDGLVIGDNAFAHNDGKTVPILWQHNRNSIDNLLGHGVLENRPDGVYIYGTFNNTKQGREAKEAVMHGDLSALSIYANKLQKNDNVVTHGDIKEVSLVVSGANKGAYIDYRSFAHGEDDSFTEGILFLDEQLDYINHEDNDGGSSMDVDAIIDSMTDEQRELLFEIAGLDDNTMEHAEDSSSAKSNKTVGDVLDSLTEEQQLAVAYIIEQIMKDKGGDTVAQSKNMKDKGGDTVAQSENMEEEIMKTNVFESQNGTAQRDALMHAEEVKNNILADLKKCGSLREAARAHEDEISELAHSMQTNSGDTLAHAADVVVGTGTATYGIKDIDWLFPEARNITNTPEFIKRQDEWVAKVMGGVSHTPFTRIKTMFADITADEARAKGYVKGHQKTEEVFGLLKRVTTPTTVYKKQKLDRDDIIDITDFDVVMWLRAEMRLMLNEELARAYLIGDGRSVSSNDKINEQNIRPIYSDDVLFTIRQRYAVSSTATNEEKAKSFIEQCIRSRKDYRGSGNPMLFTTEDMLIDMLLINDGIGHRLYKTLDELKTALRVSDIVAVPQMSSVSMTDTTTSTEYICDGIIINLKDYSVGTDKGGAVSMFDDFDIDYNQQKYLMETRCSAALVRPKSAIVVEHSVSTASGGNG